MPNLVLMLQTNGTHQASFWPTAASFTSPILATMLADKVVGPKTTLIKGINLNKIGNPGGNGHDWGWHGLYLGVDNIGKGGDQFGGGPSVDQVLLSKLKFQTPFKNIHCGVTAANYKIINAGRSSLVCQSAGLQVPPEIDIYALYTKVFGSVTTTGPATRGTRRRPPVAWPKGNRCWIWWLRSPNAGRAARSRRARQGRRSPAGGP